MVHCILSNTAATLLGYISVMLLKCISGVAALPVINYLEQGVSFPAQSCHWCIASSASQSSQAYNKQEIHFRFNRNQSVPIQVLTLLLVAALGFGVLVKQRRLDK